MKTGAKVLAGMALLIVLVWSATLLYWHFTIRARIRTLQAEGAAIFDDFGERHRYPAFASVHDAGCRAIPYLVDSVEPEGDYRVQVVILSILTSLTPQDCCPFFFFNRIEEADSPEVRRSKCDRVHAWWKESGGKTHQWWRVWSPKCGKGED